MKIVQKYYLSEDSKCITIYNDLYIFGFLIHSWVKYVTEIHTSVIRGSDYYEKLKKQIYDKISTFFNTNSTWNNDKNINDIVNNYVIIPYLGKKHIQDFYEYYFKIINNKEYFLQTKNFFQEFAVKYGIKNIDSRFLNNLEKHKHEILNDIMNNNLSELYFNRFQLKHKGEIKGRNRDYLFSKLVHTFRPREYSPLDNNIKIFFGLEKESFYVAFKILSETYVKWINENVETTLILYAELETSLINNNYFKVGNMSTLKLLDTIFWEYTKYNVKT